jgi:hypothetical protein
MVIAEKTFPLYISTVTQNAGSNPNIKSDLFFTPAQQSSTVINHKEWRTSQGRFDCSELYAEPGELCDPPTSEVRELHGQPWCSGAWLRGGSTEVQ